MGVRWIGCSLNTLDKGCALPPLISAKARLSGSALLIEI